MNQKKYEVLHKRLRKLIFLVNKSNLQTLEELWSSYLTLGARCKRLEEELYELRDNEESVKTRLWEIC